MLWEKQVAIVLDCVFHKVSLAQGQKGPFFCASAVIRNSQV